MAFEYKRDKGKVSLAATGDVFDIACEIGYLTRNIYSSLMNKNPVVGLLFKSMVTSIVGDSNSPTWQKREPSEGDLEIVAEVPKNIFGDKDIF